MVTGESAALAAFAAIPCVGGVLQQLIGGHLQEVRFRRIEQFIRILSMRLEGSRADLLDKDYAHSTEYAEYVLHAAEIERRFQRPPTSGAISSCTRLKRLSRRTSEYSRLLMGPRPGSVAPMRLRRMKAPSTGVPCS